MASLAAHKDPRLHVALVAPFLRHPEWGPQGPHWVERLEPQVALELKTWYTAAVYLQRLWWTRLSLYLGDRPLLPDWFSQELRLSPTAERHGKRGLYTSAYRHAQRSLNSFNRLASYQRGVK